MGRELAPVLLLDGPQAPPVVGGGPGVLADAACQEAGLGGGLGCLGLEKGIPNAGQTILKMAV